MAFLPDGRLLVTEQYTGRVMVVVDGQVQPEPFTVIEGLFVGTETGLIGITAAPDFPNDPYVYLYYSERGPDGGNSRNVVIRLTAQQGRGVDPILILDDLPGSVKEAHVSGNLRFGPDGKLYVAIGDTVRSEWAQDLSNPAGTILRVNPDGSVPSDNPFVGQDGADPRIYAYGLRNPFDFTFHPVTGGLFATENGPEWNDEINLIEPGQNYGWPASVGHEVVVSQEEGEDYVWDVRQDVRELYLNAGWDPTRWREAVRDWWNWTPEAAAFGGDIGRYATALGLSPPGLGFRHPVWVYAQVIAPSGITAYGGQELPEFRNDLFMCQFLGGQLHRIRLWPPNYDRVVTDEVIAKGCTSDVEVGPDGNLYFVDILSGTIYRIVNTNS